MKTPTMIVAGLIALGMGQITAQSIPETCTDCMVNITVGVSGWAWMYKCTGDQLPWNGGCERFSNFPPEQIGDPNCPYWTHTFSEPFPCTGRHYSVWMSDSHGQFISLGGFDAVGITICTVNEAYRGIVPDCRPQPSAPPRPTATATPTPTATPVCPPNYHWCETHSPQGVPNFSGCCPDGTTYCAACYYPSCDCYNFCCCNANGCW